MLRGVDIAVKGAHVGISACLHLYRNNLVVKMSEMNQCSEEHLRAFDALPFERKFIFTTKGYGLKSQVIFKEWAGKDEIKNDTTDFRKYVDLEKWINGDSFKLKQQP